ncbi:MAG: phytase, partial [bacterium]
MKEIFLIFVFKNFTRSITISAILSLVNIAVSQEVIRGPYLQLGTPNSLVIRWRTTEATDSGVRFGLSPDDLLFSIADFSSTTEHEVTLTGLLPDKKYYYAVGTSLSVLAGGDRLHFFVTPPETGTSKPTRIWILGDSGTKNNQARAVRNAYYNFTGARHTDLWLMLGDNAYQDGTDADYQEAVFDMYPDMLRKSVLWPTRGNHDKIPLDGSGNWSGGGDYYDIFTLPKAGEAGGVASGTEVYYSFDYGNIHFICLESTLLEFRAENSPMWNWLEADLDENNQDWTIAFWHHPPYSKGSHNSNKETELIEMRQRALPILENGGVDLVLSGHSHSYERSFLLDQHYARMQTLVDSMVIDGGDGKPDGDGAYYKPIPGAAPNLGAVYVVAGSSGKTTSGHGLNHLAMVTAQRTLGSVVLDIDGTQLNAQFIDTLGVVQDYFTITKPANEASVPVHFVMIDGDNQTGVIGETLAEPLVVEVRDNFQNPVAGVTVTFEVIAGEGTLSHSRPYITGADGRADVTLQLGSSTDTVKVRASAGRLYGSPKIFTAIPVLTNTPVLEIDPAVHNFGEVSLGSRFSKTFMVRNVGTAELIVLTTAIINGDTSEFNVVSGQAPFSIMPNDFHEVEVGFSPDSEGGKTALLRLISNDILNKPLDIILTGTGISSNIQNKIWPVLSTSSTPGDTDDPAFWIHPTDPSKSVIIGTDKSAGIFVWDMNGVELQRIPQGTSVNNVDVRQNVRFGGQMVDIVAANLRDQGKLAVFQVNPDYTNSDVLIQIANKDSSHNDIQRDSYGFCLYRRPSDQALFVFERPKSRGEIRQYRIEAGAGGSGALVTPVRDLNYSGGIAEGFVADDMAGFVYITEEDVGIHKYYAHPDSSSDPLSTFARGDGTADDREGVGIYACNDGTGYLVLSSQGNSTIKIYERQGNNRFVKTITALDEQGQAGLGTDGLDVTSYAVPPNFPNGFLVVHDQSGKRFHLYDWTEIAGTELAVCPNSMLLQPVLSMNSRLYHFAEVAVDSSDTLNIEIKNTGPVNLHILDLSLLGNDASSFKLLNWSGPFVIAPEDSQTISMEFRPTGVGEKVATLRIGNDDPDNNPFEVTVVG